MLKRSLWLTVLAFLLLLPAPEPARAACDYEIGESGTTLTATRTDINEELTCIETALAAVGGGGVVADGDYGDVIVSGSGATWLVDTATVPKLAVANTFTATQEIQLSNDGALFGPDLQFDRVSASPAASDGLGRIQFLGRNDGGAAVEYSAIAGVVVDATAGLVDGRIQFRTTVNNSVAGRFNIAQGFYSQNLTDGGANTINVSDYFDDGANINTLYQGVDSDLTAIAALTTAAYGRDFLTYANEAAFKAAVNLEAGTDFYAPGGTDVALADGGTGQSLSDPGADRILWWDESDNALELTSLSDLATEAAPASGDFLVMVDAAGALLKVDWSSLPSGSLSDGDKGDIVVSSSGTVLSIDQATGVTAFGAGDTFPCFEAGVIKECAFEDLPGAGAGISNVVEDATPQLGGNLDGNSFAINLTTTGTSAIFTATSTDAGTTFAPRIELYRDSASPLAADLLGIIVFNAEDSAGNTVTYADIFAELVDPTNGSEDGALQFQTRVADSLATRFKIGSGLYYGSGSDMGASTVNATGYYISGTSLFATGNSWTSTQAFITTSAGVASAYSRTNEDGASAGPVYMLERASTSPAANDDGGQLLWRFRDSGGNILDAVQINVRVLDPTDTSEDAVLRVATMVGGALGTRFNIGAGIYYAAGTDQGAGTVNATGLYVNGSNISTIYQPLDSDLTAIAALTTNSAGRSILTLTDPNADRIAFWDDSGGAYAHLTVASPLAISTTTLDVDSATSGAEGVCELATTGEVETGTDTTRCVTAAGVLAAVTGTKTISIPGSALIPGVTQPCTTGTAETNTNDITHGSCNFTSTSADEYGWFQIAMPKGWDESTISAQFYWTSELGTGNVVWGLACLARSDNDTLDAALGTQVTVTDAELSPNDIMISGATGAHTIGGSPAEGDIIFCRVARVGSNGSDTFSGTAKLVAVKVLYGTASFTDD